MQSPNVAGGGAARPGRRLDRAGMCWTMDSPTEDGMASESTRMWCVAKSCVAMREVPRRTVAMALDLGARASCLHRCAPGTSRAPAIRDRPPQRVQQGVQHLPHMAQLADFMRYQVHAAIPAVAVHA